MLNIFLEKLVTVIHFAAKDYKLIVNSIDFKINIFERKHELYKHLTNYDAL